MHRSVIQCTSMEVDDQGAIQFRVPQNVFWPEIFVNDATTHKFFSLITRTHIGLPPRV